MMAVGRQTPSSMPNAWRVGRVDEGTSLENWHALTGIVGSNPTPSATKIYCNTKMGEFYEAP